MNDIRFVYATKEAEQLAFDGVNRRVDVFATPAHISYQGSIMCGTDESKLKTEYGSRKIRKVQNRPHGLGICEKCERLYKANGQLEWYKWTDAVGLHGVNK